MLDPEHLAGLNFCEAAEVWFNSHTLHVASQTVRHYANCIRALKAFFSALRLDQIHIGHLEQYQRMRSAGSGGLKAAGPSCINHELNTLSQILTRANLWAPIAPNYRPMPLPRPNVGRALEEHEELRLWRAASSNTHWMVAYCCALISANTTADASALRVLRLKNIHLDRAEFDIEEGEKNKYRLRTLPLNDTALWAMNQLLSRAHEKGACRPDHFLLPHRARNGGKGFDPTRPINTWKTAWRKLRAAAGMPTLRFKDLRHHAITRLLENENISERTVIDMAGHVGSGMLKRYSHIRMKTKRDAVDELARRAPRSTGSGGLALVKK